MVFRQIIGLEWEVAGSFPLDWQLALEHEIWGFCVLTPIPGMLFTDGKLGVRVRGELSSKSTAILMVWWYNQVEVGTANLDIQFIIMESRSGKGKALEASCTREKTSGYSQKQTSRAAANPKMVIFNESISVWAYHQAHHNTMEFGRAWGSPVASLALMTGLHKVGGFREIIWAECTWWLATDLFIGFCPGCVKLGYLYGS